MLGGVIGRSSCDKSQEFDCLGPPVFGYLAGMAIGVSAVDYMGAGIYKKHNTTSAVLEMVLSASVLLYSVVLPVHATREDDEALARKFAPILVLTENPTEKGRKYTVINPEPVEIVGAKSVSNVQVIAVDGAGGPYYLDLPIVPLFPREIRRTPESVQNPGHHLQRSALCEVHPLQHLPETG